jgi:hypothetical protein
MCCICSHPHQAEMLVDYAYRLSLRRTANAYGVNYRSLARHIENCLPVIMAEYEENQFQQHLKEEIEFLRGELIKDSMPKRRTSIIKRKVKTSWGRRNWKNGTKRKRAISNHRRSKEGGEGERSVTSKK